MKEFKKYYRSIFLLLILNSIIIAQDLTSTAWDSSHLGIQIGANLSAIGSNSSSPSSRLGLNLGIYLTFPLNNKSHIQPEFWFIQKGSLWGCWTFQETCPRDYRNYYISYLQLPVYYSYSLVQDKEIKIQFGPFFSYAISRKAEEAVENVSVRGNYRINNIIKKYDYGVSLSLQLFTIPDFYIRFIYDYSLSNIFKTTENIGHVDASTAKLWSLIFFIGYDFSGTKNGIKN